MSKADTVTKAKARAEAERNEDPHLSQLTVANLVCELCRRVGLEPDDVGELWIRPDKLTATVYKRNGNGQKYLWPNGKPATETWEVALRP